MRISSATSYSHRRAIVCAQSSSGSCTSGAQRYSSTPRSKASASASSESSSYTARAWPISFCAMDENATSSSSIGAIPVHSESRQPMISSSSARPSSSSSFTSLLQPRLDRVAVDAPVLQVEFVGPVVDDVHRAARPQPQRHGFAPPAVLLARPRLRELCVRRDDGAGVLERSAAPVLPKDLPLV